MMLRVARSRGAQVEKKDEAREAVGQINDTSPAEDVGLSHMIETRGIVKTFKNAAGEFTVLKGIDLTIDRGEFVSIVGKSGSGKSTLLNMITGIDHPTVRADDRRRHGYLSQHGREPAFALARKKSGDRVPVLPVASDADPARKRDVADGLCGHVRFRRTSATREGNAGTGRFGKAGQQTARGRLHGTTAGRGDRACALACDPPLLVADEPTGNLDSKSADAIIDLFEKLVSEGKTILMVTHDPSLTSRTDRNIIISDGELIDEAVSRALPLMRHRHMLEMTKKAQRVTYQPGEIILECDQHVDNLFIVKRGAVDVMKKTPAEKLLAHLGVGDLFGEIELLRGGHVHCLCACLLQRAC